MVRDSHMLSCLSISLAALTKVICFCVVVTRSWLESCLWTVVAPPKSSETLVLLSLCHRVKHLHQRGIPVNHRWYICFLVSILLDCWNQYNHYQSHQEKLQREVNGLSCSCWWVVLCFDYWTEAKPI